MKICYAVLETTSSGTIWQEELENANESQPPLLYLEQSDKNNSGLNDLAIALGAIHAAFLLWQVRLFPTAVTC